MAGKGPQLPLGLDLEVTDELRFEAKLKHMEDETVIFLAMGALEPLKRVGEDMAARARMVFAEVLDRWVPEDVAAAGAAFLIGESDHDPRMPDEEEVEEFAYLLAIRDQYPDLMRETLAEMEAQDDA